MSRAVCFHLHCYQPPRASPWLGVVEPEPSALPHRDWNARVTAECYRPNTAARVLGRDGTIAAVDDNWARTSWNVVPTLHAWLERNALDVDAALLAADAEALRAGQGRALFSPAIHAILPLAPRRDRETLVAWGIADFRRRFGRAPEGCWLPEAAVDVDTLEVLAGRGIRFTVLMAGQAARVRRPGGSWRDVSGERVDPTRAYRVPLPSGRSIVVFFGHGPLSRAIAFDGLLHDGSALARAVRDAMRPGDEPQLVSLVVDGETFGHHHEFADMALAWALRELDGAGIQATTFGRFLADHPPVDEVELVDPSSWSCAHGVERWRADCGCVTGGEPAWSQAWRTPLRAAIDWLVERLGGEYERAAAPLLGDVWAARDAYGEVIAGSVTPAEFVARRAPRPLRPDEQTRALRLLELERHALAATTSCAWFFADPAGIETTISLRHADRALALTRETVGVDLESEFLARLLDVHSNDPVEGDGGGLWAASVVPVRTGPERVAAAAALAAAAGGPATTVRGEWETRTGTRLADTSVRVSVEHRPTLARYGFDVTVTGDALAASALVADDDGTREPLEVALADLEPDAVAAVARVALAADGDERVALRALARRLRTDPLGPAEAVALGALLAAAAPLEGDTLLAAQEVLVAARDAAARDDAVPLPPPLARSAAALGVLLTEGVARREGQPAW